MTYDEATKLLQIRADRTHALRQRKVAGLITKEQRVLLQASLVRTGLADLLPSMMRRRVRPTRSKRRIGLATSAGAEARPPARMWGRLPRMYRQARLHSHPDNSNAVAHPPSVRKSTLPQKSHGRCVEGSVCRLVSHAPVRSKEHGVTRF